MSDILSALGIGNNSSATKPKTASEQVADAYRATQQKPLDALKKRQQDLEKRSSFFSTLRSRLDSAFSSFNTITDLSTTSSKVGAKKTTVSDSSFLSASAADTTQNGINTIKIERLASNDRLIAKQIDNLSSTQTAFGSGTKTFNLATGSNSSTAISVTFDGSETNEQALNKIASAVNANTDLGISASVVKSTTSSGRLTFTAKESGTSGKITFSESGAGNDVLATLGIDASLNQNNATRGAFDKNDPSKAGFSQGVVDNLDAKLQINGIEATRTSNKITDIVAGLTINLTKAQEASAEPITITIDNDTSTANSNIRPFLDSYNNVINYLNEQATTVRSDSALRGLQSNLRSIVNSKVSDGALNYLSDVGIKIGTDGTLSISDSTKFSDAIEANSAGVSKLFTDLATKVNNEYSKYRGSDGILSTRTKSTQDQIVSTKSRIDTLGKSIDKRVETYKKEYERSLQLMSKATAQTSILSTL